MLEQRCTVGEIKKERKEDERRDENEEEGIINERKKKRCWKVARFEKEKKKKYNSFVGKLFENVGWITSGMDTYRRGNLPSEIMRVKGSAFGAWRGRRVEETLTTPITSGGKAGVWEKKKEEGKGGMGEEEKVDAIQISLLRILFVLLCSFSICRCHHCL